ncbi:disease resistance RPP13-like protein 1 [Canna indica]|uniref:Disease resistance RPP13-like protein 1 n=1 Tax=Canna indica TaxID=4628 RepID=A0AAQ3KB38_9LILI|nr:disease resistance RPP13-like protein 1 [Canna indica]
MQMQRISKMIPQWLPAMIENHEDSEQWCFRKFEMQCNVSLLKSCLKEGENWPVIKQIPDVQIRTFSGESFITYIKNLRFRHLVPIDMRNNLVNDLEPYLFSSGFDSLSWKWSANGDYITNRFYCILTYRGIIDMKCSFIWQKECPPACSIHSWLVEHKRLLTKDRLRSRNMHVCPTCIICNNNDETHTHLFIDCHFTMEG